MYLVLRVFRGIPGDLRTLIEHVGVHLNSSCLTKYKNSIGSHPIPQLWPMTQPNEDPVFDGDSRLDRITWEAVLVNTAPRFAQLSRGHAPSEQWENMPIFSRWDGAGESSQN